MAMRNHSWLIVNFNTWEVVHTSLKLKDTILLNDNSKTLPSHWDTLSCVLVIQESS